MINITVAGNLGKDAELKTVGNDQVCSFSVASSRKSKGNEVTAWITCDIWGKRGTALAGYLTKGSKVVVVGELQTREHQGKTYLSCRVSEIELMGGKSGGRGKDPEPQRDAPDDGGKAADDDDRIPF